MYGPSTDAACQMIEMAQMLGGKDNATCIAVDVTDSKLPEARRENKREEDDMTTQQPHTA